MWKAPPINQEKVDAINEAINPPNKYKILNTELNQWDNKKQFYQCSFYASAQNLSYNCGIHLSESDLDIIAEQQNKLWLFNYTQWARWLDSTNAVLKYVINKGNKNVKLIQLFDNDEIKRWIYRWYIIMTWISVNDKFKQDVLDWKIDAVDYKTLYGNSLNHYLNLWDWKLIDNYNNNSQHRPNEYICNVDEILNDISQRTKFVFINY